MNVVITINDAEAECLPEIRKNIEKLPARSTGQRYRFVHEDHPGLEAPFYQGYL